MEEKKNGNVQVQSENDNATCRVPDSERKGFLSVAFVAAGYCICMSGLYTGAAIAFGMTLKNAIIAIVSVVLYFILMKIFAKNKTGIIGEDIEQ